MSTALDSVVSLAERAGDLLVRGVRAAVTGTTGGGAGESKPPASGWLVVTINREPADLDTGVLPKPLAEYGEGIETRIRPAAGGKGTELAVRQRRRQPGPTSVPARVVGNDAQAELRAALRKAKQLIEVGEVLRVDPTPHGARKPTPTGALLEAATKRAPGGGVL